MNGKEIQKLIDFQKQNLESMDNVANMFGGMNNPIIKATKGIAMERTENTIKALEEYRDMLDVKNLIDN